MSSKYQIYFDSFSSAFNKALEINDISLVKFSKKIGKDIAQVSRYSTGVNIPHDKIRQSINNLLSVTIRQVDKQWILEYHDIPNQNDIPNPDSNSHLQAAEPKVAYADQVVLEPNGKLSPAEIRQLLEQIELLVKIVKGSLRE
jgi:hypothetical protein